MRLRNARSQDRADWCVPATIENLLRHYGECKWSQQRIVSEWAEWKNGASFGFDLGSPQEFVGKTELGSGFSFEFRRVPLNEARSILEQRAAAGRPTIVSCALPGQIGGAHMRIVTSIFGDVVEFFDPDPSKGDQECLWGNLAPLLGDAGRKVDMLLIDPLNGNEPSGDA